MRIEFGRLFLAVPELTFKVDFIRTLDEMGLIDKDLVARIKRQQKIAKNADKAFAAAMTGEGILKRLLTVAPEIINEDLIDLLSGVTWYQRRKRIRVRQDPLFYEKKMELISPAQANMMRLALRTLKAASRGGLPSDKDQVVSRLMRVLGVNLSNERINLWRNLGLISVEEAERYRGYLAAGTVVQESLAKAIRAKSLYDSLLYLGGFAFDTEFVNGLVRSGLLSEGLADSYKALVAFGLKEWKTVGSAKNARSLQERLLIVLTGSMNRELLQVLYTQGIIDKQTRSRLLVLEVFARRANDRLLQDLTARRFRVKPGEAPIKTFARASRVSEGDLLRLLSAAAAESQREAEKLARGLKPGATARSLQYKQSAAALHRAMRDVWDGVGYLTILGEREVAEAAAESITAMNKKFVTGQFDQLGLSLTYQAKAGVDSYISRAENTLSLSRRVYKNQALWIGQVDKRIILSLLQGRSAAEIAQDVRKYIDPGVKGGVSYAAMRLARTEINNAFHLSTIRYTREQPWVRGYKWNRSGSHKTTDICDTYANDDHDGLGPGVFKKANVPGKPHPQCLCYLTTVQMSEAEFVAAYKKGRFKSYLSTLVRSAA